MADQPSERETTNDSLIRSFMDAFASKDANLLARFLHPDVSFENYGDAPLRGRQAVLNMWSRVFEQFEAVEFQTLSQAVSGNLVIAEQIHGLALQGRALAPIRNMAVYEIREGMIVEWRDYTNPVQARSLLAG